MKKMQMIIAAMAAALALALPAFAAEDCCPTGVAPKCAGPTLAAAAAGPASGANPHAGMEMGAGTGVQRINEGKKEGYSFAFEIMPLKGEGYTHHLMVSVKDASGKELTGAKVGFDVASPAKGKKDQKVMAMGMGGGYGANLDFSAKGKYTIKTKVVGGGVNLLYDFVFEVK